MPTDHNSHNKIEVLSMVLAFLHAVPFRPFEITTTGGTSLPVPHEDFAQVSVRGSRVYVDGPGGTMTMVHASQISHVAHKASRKAKKAA